MEKNVLGWGTKGRGVEQKEKTEGGGREEWVGDKDEEYDEKRRQ